MARLAAAMPPAAIERLAMLLRAAADPDAAAHCLSRLAENQPGAFQRMAASPVALQHLVTLFSHSRFLSEEVLRSPDWIEGLTAEGDLHTALAREDYEVTLRAELPEGPPRAIDLAAFRRRRLLRILLRDALGLAPLAEITGEISGLADAILDESYRRIRAGLERRHGTPSLANGRPCGLSIVALGKLGGQELNYSSDIDLMFVHEGNGETRGPEPLSNREFHNKVCAELTGLLSSYTPHGSCYRVDLRLRPDGQMGELCISLDAARKYYRTRARDWELQMAIKARVAAGDPGPGGELLDAMEPLTYSTAVDFSKVEAVSEARVRLSEKLARKKGKPEADVKLAPGGIRDVEFLTQCLQQLHGGREPFVRHGGTQLALFRLHSSQLLSDIEYGRLHSAYLFLRNLEHRLQAEDDRQTHTLPSTDAGLELLARRMPVQPGAEPSAANLRAELETHLENVRAIYERVVHAQLPHNAEAEPDPAPQAEPPHGPDNISANLARIIQQQAPGLAATIAQGRLRHGARAFEHFLERLLPAERWRRWLNDDAVLAGYAIDIFEHSPYFAEQLNRRPEWLEELYEMRRRPGSRADYASAPSILGDPADLRRFFHREMFRVQAGSICLRAPIFATLARTSALADAAIVAAYQMALTEVTRETRTPGYEPGDRMMIVALGRLGMAELDLGSDADLVFVLPDRDAAWLPFWTRVAERAVSLLSAYTGEGSLFAVDTRLRPNGGAGPLVQTEGGFRDYFWRHAQAWEGITYMKSRAVAGNLAAGTEFLRALQEVDWRRWGQAGRSRTELRRMRLRLEQEQAKSNPLKAGPGGYYDIDFALMYLRLRSAGIFYPVLNTPARINVIEQMGHLDRADSRFLTDAATFYRAVDHAMRLSSGHARGQLPAAELQLEAISELVERWTPAHLHDQPLPVELGQIQRRTREFFDRLFHE